ncbi:DUF4870 domain-containing protein [Actinomadura sp. 7K507]|uniref:DUF4870 domain-containing protein n=1 Tax=Actinomadura sp. 7K507 TaxID=2530365 RepID=UPI00105346AE|nr:DUF4870 domain-containing protein [Actinomadura sp. 7K507]TDC87941.1 DUF4870 domain-containing protein [Actinomadura sp. 7K507]
MTDQPPPPDQPPPYPGSYGQAPGQPPYGAPPGGQPPYGAPPGGQPPYGAPPGGQPPPGGPYDPRWGYGPPGVPYGPQQPPAQDTTWAVFSYVGVILVGFLAPLIIYLVKKNTEPFTRFHAAQALNYQITLLIHLLAVAAVCVPPAIILEAWAFLALLALPYLELLIGQWVFLILGAVKSGKRQYYRFPTFFCFRMIR